MSDMLLYIKEMCFDLSIGSGLGFLPILKAFRSVGGPDFGLFSYMSLPDMLCTGLDFAEV